MESEGEYSSDQKMFRGSGVTFPASVAIIHLDEVKVGGADVVTMTRMFHCSTPHTHRGRSTKSLGTTTASSAQIATANPIRASCNFLKILNLFEEARHSIWTNPILSNPILPLIS